MNFFPLFVFILFNSIQFIYTQQIITLHSASQPIEKINDLSKNYHVLTFDDQTQFVLGHVHHDDYQHLKNNSCKDCITVERNQKIKMAKMTKTQQHVPSWGLSRISQRELPLTESYSYPKNSGKNVDIYIVDSGVNINHPDFEGRAEWGANFVKGSPDEDENGHGTIVAGIAAGKSVGVAKKANIISVKCLGQDGNGNMDDIIQALHYVMNRIKKNKSKKQRKSIVNISISSDKNVALNQAVDALTRAGAIVVVAAGNSLPSDDSTVKNSCEKSPASAKTAVTVGSTDDKDQLSNFSNIGKCVDILAPGESIISENDEDDDKIIAYSGTSYSAPHVAGILALYWGEKQPKHQSLTNTEVINKLYNLATPNIVKNITDDTPNLLAFVGYETPHSNLIAATNPNTSSSSSFIYHIPISLYFLSFFTSLLCYYI
ncbi:unnamed protein product [Cunninghamella blakesleeana]